MKTRNKITLILLIGAIIGIIVVFLLSKGNWQEKKVKMSRIWSDLIRKGNRTLEDFKEVIQPKTLPGESKTDTTV